MRHPLCAIPLLLTLFILPQIAFSTRLCPALLGDEAHLEKVVTRITKLHRVEVRDNEEIVSERTNVAGGEEIGVTGGGYRVNERTLTLTPFDDVRLRLWSLHHESVHLGTDVNFRRPDPPARAAALAIILINQTADLDDQTPETYRRQFQIDEMKAYFKSGRYMGAIADLQYQLFNPLAPIYSNIALRSREDSLYFARVTKRLLERAIAYLEENGDHFEEEAEVFLYRRDSVSHYRTRINLTNEDGSVTSVSIPFYDRDAADTGDFADFVPRLLMILREGLFLAEHYRRESGRFLIPAQGRVRPPS